MLPTNEEIERAARCAHEVNRAYCAHLGDHSQVPWDEAPDWQQASCRDGVRFIIDNPDATPESSHANWLRFKAAEGWSYGPVKNAAMKIHPCFRPYNELPADQRAKDALFHATVRALLF